MSIIPVGVNVPIPTGPAIYVSPFTFNSATLADVVPMPTLPLEKIAAVVAFENVVVPVNVLASVPDCV